MKTGGKHTYWQIMFCFMLMLCQHHAVIAYDHSAETQNSQPPVSKKAITIGQTANQVSAPVSSSTARKKSLNDESRDISAFLMIGIGINIVMAIVFGWWFTGEWRKTKKIRKDVHD